jgi:prepilin-type N-terminal cleavage/methylation domain-containing protein
MRNKYGFTLVELLVVVAIVAIVAGAIYGVFQSSNRTYVVQDAVMAMQQDARFGLKYVAEQAMMAGYDPRGIGENTFGFQLNATWDGDSQTCNATNLAFTMDDDQDGAVNVTDTERAAFRLQGGALQRFRNANGSPPAGWDTIITGVDTANSFFTYVYSDQTSDNAPNATNLDKIRDVRITLVMNPPQLYGKTLQAKSYTTLVKCRNMASR